MGLANRHPKMIPLATGDRLTQLEFHRRYEACPEDLKAELIGGIVYVASPVRRRHAHYHPELNAILWLYKKATPGIELLDNATLILGGTKEPQPDLALRILPEYGGQSGDTRDEYIDGAPELAAEIAHSTREIDLRQKRLDYRRAGILEYIVLCIEEQELRWFDFRLQVEITPTRQGIYRSHVFPGLWIDGPALLDRDSDRIEKVVLKGLASRPHAAFKKRLLAAHRRLAP